MSEFMGKNSFNWFVGVVEDRADPKSLGRLRVRCLGYHTEDLLKLPTADLPWSHVMNPITSATISGLGQTPLGAVEGTWVVGFFQDGADAQMPIIIGTLPGVPAELPTLVKTEGGKFPGKGFQDYLNANYPKYKDETDVNRLAVNDLDLPHSTLTIRQADRTEDVGRADFDEDENFIVNIPNIEKVKLAADDGTNFSEPKTPYDAEYPYNHVYESEGGHIREMDDTKEAERIHERHASGTGYEIGPDGTKVTRVKMDNYTIVTGDDYAHIQGTGRQTTDGGLRVRVNSDGEEGNNYNIEVGSNANVNVEVNKGNINLTTLSPDVGDININASRDLNVQVNRNFTVAVLGDAVETITGKKDEIVAGKNTKTGSEIDMDADPINLN